MWQLIFDYVNLKNPQELFKCIQKHYDEFDWNWPDADRWKNFNALQSVLHDYIGYADLWIKLWGVQLEDGDVIKTVFYYEQRMHTYIDLYPNEWIESWLDFSSALDVLKVLDDWVATMNEHKNFYQIKAA